jgi:hypothetical protein
LQSVESADLTLNSTVTERGLCGGLQPALFTLSSH